jgi:hypothetical protein
MALPFSIPLFNRSMEKDNVRIEDLLARRLEQEKSVESEKDQTKEDQEGTTASIISDSSHGSGLRRRGGNTGDADSNNHHVDLSSSTADDDDLKKKREASGRSCIPDSLSSTLSTTSIATTATKAKKKERNPDPLLWFGVFVPASLRMAQTVFKQGKGILLECGFSWSIN